MKKFMTKVVSLAFVSVIAFALVSCNGVSNYDSNKEFDASTQVSRSAITGNTVRIYSDLNPGYGQAVYFTGTFYEGNNWSYAIRGTYDNGWYADVSSTNSFEWKALTGSYDLGEVVGISAQLTWESGENHVQELENSNLYVLTAPGYAKYGATCYFTGTFDGANNWQNAYINDGFNWTTYKWFIIVSSSTGNFEWKYLTGFGSSGSPIAAPYSYNWCEGDNFTQDDALTFAEYWAEYAKVDYFYAWYNEDTGKLSLNGAGLVYGINSSYQNDSETIFQILKNGEVIYEANYNDVRENGVELTFNRIDYSIYTARVIPVSIFGDLGCPYDVEFSPTMVRFNYASFTMGSDSDTDENNAEHRVTLYNKYFLSKYEVTDAEFKEIFGVSSANLAYKVYLTDDDPAIALSFPFAIAYCNLRSVAEGLTPVYSVEGVDFADVTFDYLRNLSAEDRVKWNNATWNKEANGYRLPTEAEWEFAARDPQDSDMPYSGSYDITEVANTLTANSFQALPVGSLKANWYGIYDMSGNAEEWVWDFYAPYSTDSVYDPVVEQGTNHLTRGGGFNFYGDEYFTVYARHEVTGGYSSSTGLRLARNAN